MSPSAPISNCFAAHKYEYEISPEKSTCFNLQSQSKHIITETSLPMTKTIFLIRHAESDENRRKECFKTSVQGLGKLKLPKREDVVASMELMNLRAQLDSDVSPRGQAQIDQLGKRIANDDFVRKMGIELVAHSPLKRARQTSYGMLQCVTPCSSSYDATRTSTCNHDKDDHETQNVNDNDDDPTVKGCKHPCVKRVVELDILSERTPMEWLPIQHDAYTKRIAEFELWLSQQPEDVIAIVGHSLYFKNMLGLESKFQNVDVWSLQFDFTVKNSIQKVRRDVHLANETETKKRIQKHFEKIGNLIHKSKHNDDGKYQKSNEESTSFDYRDENDTSFPRTTRAYSETQTEIDGVNLEELKLPRGWKQLKHHYRFDAMFSDDR